jgi:hypothetical protein
MTGPLILHGSTGQHHTDCVIFRNDEVQRSLRIAKAVVNPSQVNFTVVVNPDTLYFILYCTLCFLIVLCRRGWYG